MIVIGCPAGLRAAVERDDDGSTLRRVRRHDNGRVRTLAKHIAQGLRIAIVRAEAKPRILPEHRDVEPLRLLDNHFVRTAFVRQRLMQNTGIRTAMREVAQDLPHRVVRVGQQLLGGALLVMAAADASRLLSANARLIDNAKTHERRVEAPRPTNAKIDRHGRVRRIIQTDQDASQVGIQADLQVQRCRAQNGLAIRSTDCCPDVWYSERARKPVSHDPPAPAIRLSPNHLFIQSASLGARSASKGIEPLLALRAPEEITLAASGTSHRVPGSA